MTMTFHFAGASLKRVVPLLLALFVPPAVGYSADPSSTVLEGIEAYEAKDYAQVRALYDQACKGGDAGGCYSLGFMFEVGEGGPLGFARARELYDKACMGGLAQAC